MGWGGECFFPTYRNKLDNESMFLVDFYIFLPYKKIQGLLSFEPRCEKPGLEGFRPGPAQTGLYSHRRWLEV